MSDELTTVLAVVGAATGVTSTVTEVVRTRRDRSRLRLRVETRSLMGRPPRIVINLLNDSPRAITVREVGLYARPVRVEMSRQGEDHRNMSWAEIEFPFNERPLLMEAYETREFAGVPDIFTHGIHADEPLRVYALDGRNRRTWGSAAPYARHTFGNDPPIEETDDAGMKWSLTPDGKIRRPWPVESRWKLWKRRELRRSTDESRAITKQQKVAGTLRMRGAIQRFDPEEEPYRPSEGTPGAG